MYNISGALSGGADIGLLAPTVDEDGTPCIATASVVSHPTRCTVTESRLSRSLRDLRDVVFEFDFGCAAN